MSVRMSGIVTHCAGCPNFSAPNCGLLGQRIEDRSQIASFCPLSIYPAKQLADMEHAIALATKNDLNFCMVVLRFVASKVAGTLSANNIVSIPVADIQTDCILMRYDCMEVIFSRSLIKFTSSDNQVSYELYIGTVPKLFLVTENGLTEISLKVK